MSKVRAILYIRRDYQQLVTGCHIQCWGRWFGIIVLNPRAPTDKTRDESDSFYEEVGQVYDDFPRYHMRILWGVFHAKLGREVFLSFPLRAFWQSVTSFIPTKWKWYVKYIYLLPITSYIFRCLLHHIRETIALLVQKLYAFCSVVTQVVHNRCNSLNEPWKNSYIFTHFID
jgi:hypothetical protein